MKKILLSTIVVTASISLSIANQQISNEQVNQLEGLSSNIKKVSSEIQKSDKLLIDTCQNIDQLELAYYQANKNQPNIQQKIKEYAQLKDFCKDFMKAKQEDSLNEKEN